MASQAASVRKQTEAFFDAISRGAHESFLLLFAEEVEYEDATAPEGVIRGKPRVREHLEAVAREWRSIMIYWAEGAILVEGLASFSMVNYSLADTEHRRFICKAFFQLTFDDRIQITRIKMNFDRDRLKEQLISRRLTIPVALITGSGSGLGAAIAQRLYRDGMHVVIVDIKEDLGRKKADELQGLYIKADVSEGSQVELMINRVSEKYQRIDCMVNNAGITGPRSPIVGFADDAWHKVLKNNLDSVYYGMKFCLRVMQRQGYGVIINMSSISGIVGYENVAPYTSAKAAIIGLTRSTALEAARYGVRVNCLCPTGILTDSVEQIIQSSPNPEVMEKQFSSCNPLPGSPRPIDVARAASFLASEESRFITGIPLIIDAGYTSK